MYGKPYREKEAPAVAEVARTAPAPPPVPAPAYIARPPPEQKKRRLQALPLLCCFLVVVAIIVAGICGSGHCSSGTASTDCEMSGWSVYGACSKTCGTDGTKKKTRSVVTQALNGGKACPITSESADCNRFACPIDCEMSGWSVYGACSKTCGTDGTKQKTRSVVTQALNGGETCPVTSESADCNRFACPIIVPVLLQLKSQSSTLKGTWAELTSDTKDADVEGLQLKGVTITNDMLTKLDVSYMDVTGQVPDFSKNTALQELHLYNNKLTGTIPDFSKNTALKKLDMAYNELKGEIGDFSKNVKLTYLLLNGNDLTGTKEWKADKSNYPSGCSVYV